MSKYWLVIICMLIFKWIVAQENKIIPDGYNMFYYSNGQISSEGYMVKGQPDGYWKTFYENGILKSEGNRKNFELDSLWKFYDEKGRTILEINYANGKKNGIRTTFSDKEKMEEKFKDDIKQGLTTFYYPDGKIRQTIPFVDGLENGIAMEYTQEGIVIGLVEYKKGFVVNRERINRKDVNNLKQGPWKFFYDNGIVRMEGTYTNDKRNGYFKEYDRNRNLVSVSKYINDLLQEDVAEIADLDVRTDYYPNGKIKTVASFKNNIPEGVRREYAEDGKINRAFIFKEGVITGEGIISETGIKEGPWKEYFNDRSLQAEGRYSNGKRIGEWKFYYPGGTLEQTGAYTSGDPEGTWTWYYPSGNLLREENYLNGLPDGNVVEYDDDGTLISQGQYIEGYEDGKWIYEMGIYREEGYYRNGLRNGQWKSYYSDGTKLFEGEYIDDNPNGKHIFYWENGQIKDEGRYVMGIKEGDWIKYNYDGTPFLIITYKNGTEIKYDGVKIKPLMEEGVEISSPEGKE
ncbi:MAG: toxin-antitoxin system YwqK family antitoxin [Bacteroidetes bacterium]|nr:toxin-antitoxin system YwqK family antitoxin [Bacteroidota bacterium]